MPEGGGDGMIITQGGRFTGYGLFVSKGKPPSSGTCSACRKWPGKLRTL